MGRTDTGFGRVGTVARWLSRVPDWPLAAGGLLGLLALVEAVAAERVAERPPGTNPGLAMLLGLAATVPVAFARGYPLAAAGTVIAATFLTLGNGHRPTVAGLLALVGLCYLVGRCGPRWAPLVLVTPFVGYAIAPFGGAAGDAPFAVLLLALVAGPMLAGGARRLRTEAADQESSDRALADTLLDHVVRGERARIARELHDVVAHHISMIAIQADTARLATPGMPGLGAERLVAIGDTARTALTEMRRLLGVLREDAGAEPVRAPQPGLAQLNELLDEARTSAGSSTRLILQGQVVPLAAGVQLTAYRIVQEALTNSRRHAPGAAVDVELDYGRDALRLRIRDNGPGGRGTGARGPGAGGPGGRGSGGRGDGARGDGGGHGLLGMRERAAMVGGQLRAGPAPVSGFLVEAVLPLSGSGHG